MRRVLAVELDRAARFTLGLLDASVHTQYPRSGAVMVRPLRIQLDGLRVGLQGLLDSTTQAVGCRKQADRIHILRSGTASIESLGDERVRVDCFTESLAGRGELHLKGEA